MGALTFNTKYGTRYDKKRVGRVRVATGDAESPAPAATDNPGRRLVCLVLIAVAAVVGYNLFIKKKSS